MKAISKLSTREKRIVIITVVLLVLIGGYYGVYENLRQEWMDLQQEIEIGRASCRERV